MNISRSALKKFVEDNPKLVSRKASKLYPGLFVIKYTKNVFYDNLWYLDPILLECRGLVVDEKYNIIVKPFTKVFNYKENGTTIELDELCTIVEKVNGFMACATLDRDISDELIISSTGSLDSTFVDLARSHINPFKDLIFKNIQDGQTLIFEVCDKDDPHIIPEVEGLYLIGSNIKSYNLPNTFYKCSEESLDILSANIGCLRPYHLDDLPFKEVLNSSKICRHEGYMVYSKTASLKLKSPYYLITKFLARAKETKLFNIICSDRNMAVKSINEEFYPLIDYIILNKEEFIKLEEQQKIKFVSEFLGRN